MARPRRCDVFQPETVGVYHCYNRIVRRSFLCGFDPVSQRDYSHRRQWLYQRLKYLSKHFAVDILAYAVLSNHYHLVLRNRPDQVHAMSDDQVVRRWLMICPRSQRRADGTAKEPTEAEVRMERQQPGRVKELRQRLSNPSWLIRQLAQYMGIRCNAEDELTGHFWEARFGMKRLPDEPSVLACLAYVDLNPIRAGMVDSLEGYQHVSIGQRLRSLDGREVDSSDWLAPIELVGQSDGKMVTVVNRLSRQELQNELAAQRQRPLGCLPMRLEDYAELLRWLANKPENPADTDREVGTPPILQRLKLDPDEFSKCVRHFGTRSFQSAACPASLGAEAKRRSARRPSGPGKRSRAPCPAG